MSSPQARGIQVKPTRVIPTRPLLPREFVAVHKRRRIMDAIAELSAEHGYEATSIADIVRRAGVARKTLYDNFEGKEEVFLTALDSAIAEALSRTEAGCEAAGEDWRARIEAGLGALLTYVAEHPADARMCLIEALSATPASSERYDAALAQFVALLGRNAPAGTGLPETIEETLVGGVAWILNQQIRRGEAERATGLLPELSEFVLSPYHGVGKSAAEPGGKSDSTVADSRA
jgi:AcrR family transcriptional regulator